MSPGNFVAATLQRTDPPRMVKDKVDHENESDIGRNKDVLHHADMEKEQSIQKYYNSYRKALFTLEKDQFIIQRRCFLPQVAWETLTENFNTKFEQSFTIKELDSRMEVLSKEPLRSILQILLQSIVQQHKDMKSIVHPSYAELVECSRSWENILDSTQRDSGFEDIEVTISGKKISEYTRILSKQTLKKCSRAIDSIINDVESGKPKNKKFSFLQYYPPSGMDRGKLSLTDKCSKYDQIETYEHFDHPIFDRMLEFSKDPKIVEKMHMLQRSLKNAEEDFEHRKESISGIFESEKCAGFKQIEREHEEELRVVESRLQLALENDIKSLQEMHKAKLDQERQKLKSKFMLKRTALSSFLDQEESVVSKLNQQSNLSSFGDLKHKVMAAINEVDSIFGKGEYLPRLVLLSEDLEADDLRRACVSYISDSNRFQQYALRRELVSPLISDMTIMSILQKVPDEDLQEIYELGETFKYHDISEKELIVRKIALARDLKTLSNSDFRKAVVLYHDFKEKRSQSKGIVKEIQILARRLLNFPDALEKELKARRESSTISLNDKILPKDVSLCEDRVSIQLEAPHRYCSILATSCRKEGQFGKWMYEVRIEAMDNHGGSISIGWEVPRQVVQWKPNAEALISPRGAMKRFGQIGSYGVIIPGITPADDDVSYGIMWQSDGGTEPGTGLLHANGISKSGFPTFKVKDVIGCTINQDTLVPNVQFYLNGVQVILDKSVNSKFTSDMLEDIKALPNETKGLDMKNLTDVLKSNCIPITMKNYSLYPCSCLYGANRGVATRIRFNFNGSFDYPIDGYEPLGAQLFEAEKM